MRTQSPFDGCWDPNQGAGWRWKVSAKKKKDVAFGGTLVDLDPGDCALSTWTLSFGGLGRHLSIPRHHLLSRVVTLGGILRLWARVGKDFGLWRPNVSLPMPNVSSWRPNVTLEGHDVTLKRVFRCKLILFSPEFNFCKKLARSA
jgi:hypothetical protein